MRQPDPFAITGRPEVMIVEVRVWQNGSGVPSGNDGYLKVPPAGRRCLLYTRKETASVELVLVNGDTNLSAQIISGPRPAQQLQHPIPGMTSEYEVEIH